MHTLYDRGYLGVDPKFTLPVSPRLRDEFGNGEEFYAKAETPIALRERRTERLSSVLTAVAGRVIVIT